jgi:phospho-N-acetylmuramoyl-pentapeptide-transferase
MLHQLFTPDAAGTAIRLAFAALAALAAVVALIPWLGSLARRYGYQDQENKTHSSKLNALRANTSKGRTPIVGGVAMLVAVSFACLLFADWSRAEPAILLATLLGLGALGVADDLTKTFGGVKTRGLTARQKLAGQVLLGLGVGGALVWRATTGGWGEGPGTELLTSIQLPFARDMVLGLGAIGFMLFCGFLVTGTSNAVNLTDGLDGLAGGCLMVAFAFYLGVAVVVGDPSLAGSWGARYVPGAAEVGLVLAALLGALAGFLIYNRHPARVFMGDAGSLPMGGALGVAAILTKQELLLALVGGVFVAEALSVMIQVASFKLTRKRVFRCAPLHHHFEFGGWAETKVVGRFHTAAILLAALGLAGLGVR